MRPMRIIKGYILIGCAPGSIGEATWAALIRSIRQEDIIVSVDISLNAPFLSRVMGPSTHHRHIQHDLRNMEDTQTMINDALRAIEEHGAVFSGFIYAAGANHIDGIGDFSEKAFDMVMDLNLKAPWMITKSIIRYFDYAEEAVVSLQVTGVFLGSNTAYVARTKSSAYAAAKGGLVQMVRSLHRELAPRGFSLMTLDPGPVFGTNMDQKTRDTLRQQRGWNDSEYDEMILKNVPGNVPIYASDVAEQAVHLLLNGRLFGGSSLRMDNGQQQG